MTNIEELIKHPIQLKSVDLIYKKKINLRNWGKP